MFIQCPFCQTKLSVAPDGIPEMGKEKRCVNCWNRFRIVRTPDEVVVQYPQSGGTARAIDDGASEPSLHGSLTGVSGDALREKRYRIDESGGGGGAEADSGDSFAEGGATGVSGVYADFFDLDKGGTADDAQRPAAGNDEPDEVPIEKAINIDDVFGGPRGGGPGEPLSPSGMSEPRPPRILSSGDLMERQQTGFKLDFRLKPARAGALDGLRAFFQNMTRLDLALLGAFLLVLLGAALGLTDAGFFGMNWIRGAPATQQHAPRATAPKTFTRDEVYHLINLVPDAPRAETPEAFQGNKGVLPEGDYSTIFVEEVEVAVRSDPPGATVTRDDRVLGLTPLLVRLPRSNESLTLQVSYAGLKTQSLRVSASRSQEFDVSLKAPAPKTPTAPKPRPQRDQPGEDGKKTGKDEEFLIY